MHVFSQILLLLYFGHGAFSCSPDSQIISTSTLTYTFHNTATSWLDAEKTCIADGGSLPVFNTRIELDDFNKIISSCTEKIWVGFKLDCSNAAGKPELYTRIDGTSSGYVNWMQNFPSTNVNQRCAYANDKDVKTKHYTYKRPWYNDDCANTNYKYFCQYRSKNVTVAPFSFTDCCSTTNWITVPSGTRYMFFNTGLSFNDAEAMCENNSATLPLFGSKAGYYEYFNLAIQCGHDRWLGLTRNCLLPCNQASFHFINGSKWSPVDRYSWFQTPTIYWANNQPDNCGELCARNHDFLLESKHCTDNNKFVCQQTKPAAKLITSTAPECCPISGFGLEPSGIKYFYINSEVSFQTAQDKCFALGGNLPVVYTTTEMNELLQLIKNCGQDVWMGEVRECDNNPTYRSSFYYIDGSIDLSVTYNQDILNDYWRYPNPDNTDSTECVYILETEQLQHDTSCSDRKRIICQLRPNRVPINYTLPTMPYCSTTVSTRLTTNTGTVLTTTATPPPTTTTVESTTEMELTTVDYEYIPQDNVDICSSSYFEDDYYLYTIVDLSLNMTDAMDYCSQLTPPANLPLFESQAEYDSFRTLLDGCYKKSVWLGLYRPCNLVSSAGNFYWINGTSPNFTDWLNKQPDNDMKQSPLQQFCAITDKSNSDSWRDMQCGQAYPFVCQARDDEAVYPIPNFICDPTTSTTTTTGSTLTTTLTSTTTGSTVSTTPATQVSTTSHYCPFNVSRKDTTHSISYIFTNIQLGTLDGQQYCAYNYPGSNLPYFLSEAEATTLNTLLDQHCDRGLYLSGFYRLCNAPVTNDSYHWISGDSLNYTKWGNTEPNNFGNIEFCMVMDDNFNWYDTSCGYPGTVICQYRIGGATFQFPDVEAPCSITTTSPPMSTTTKGSQTSCKDGTFFISYDNVFALVTTEMTMVDAQLYCNSMSMNLPIFYTSAEYMDFLNVLANFCNDTDLWMGMYRQCMLPTVASSFQWLDQSGNALQSWINGQPDNQNDLLLNYTGLYEDQLCVLADSYFNYSWRDMQCSLQYSFVCQMRLDVTNYTALPVDFGDCSITTTTSLTTSTSDSTSTSESTSTFASTSTSESSSSSSTLTSTTTTKATKTTPPDFFYVPPAVNKCPSGFYTASDGNRYAFVNDSMSMSDAQAYCNSLSPSANLPIFRTFMEYFYFTTLLKSCYDTSVWLGLYRDCHLSFNASNFNWIDGSNATFENWIYDQPDDVVSYSDPPEEQLCIIADVVSNDEWRDLQCSFNFSFACQIRTDVTANFTKYTSDCTTSTSTISSSTTSTDSSTSTGSTEIPTSISASISSSTTSSTPPSSSSSTTSTSSTTPATSYPSTPSTDSTSSLSTTSSSPMSTSSLTYSTSVTMSTSSPSTSSTSSSLSTSLSSTSATTSSKGTSSSTPTSTSSTGPFSTSSSSSSTLSSTPSSTSPIGTTSSTSSSSSFTSSIGTTLSTSSTGEISTSSTSTTIKTPTTGTSSTSTASSGTSSSTSSATITSGTTKSTPSTVSSTGTSSTSSSSAGTSSTTITTSTTEASSTSTASSGTSSSTSSTTRTTGTTKSTPSTTSSSGISVLTKDSTSTNGPSTLIPRTSSTIGTSLTMGTDTTSSTPTLSTSTSTTSSPISILQTTSSTSVAISPATTKFSTDTSLTSTGTTEIYTTSAGASETPLSTETTISDDSPTYSALSTGSVATVQNLISTQSPTISTETSSSLSSATGKSTLLTTESTTLETTEIETLAYTSFTSQLAATQSATYQLTSSSHLTSTPSDFDTSTPKLVVLEISTLSTPTNSYLTSTSSDMSATQNIALTFWSGPTSFYIFPTATYIESQPTTTSEYPSSTANDISTEPYLSTSTTSTLLPSGTTTLQSSKLTPTSVGTTTTQTVATQNDITIKDITSAETSQPLTTEDIMTRPVDRCKFGFYDAGNGLMYTFVNKPMSMSDAQAFCNSLTPTTNLPVFHSMAEYLHYWALEKTCFNTTQWVGLYRNCWDPSDASNFYWIDGIANNISFWNTDQPDNQVNTATNEEQQCALADATNFYQWNDVQCTFMYPFACQYRPDVATRFSVGSDCTTSTSGKYPSTSVVTQFPTFDEPTYDTTKSPDLITRVTLPFSTFDGTHASEEQTESTATVQDENTSPLAEKSNVVDQMTTSAQTVEQDTSGAELATSEQSVSVAELTTSEQFSATDEETRQFARNTQTSHEDLSLISTMPGVIPLQTDEVQHTETSHSPNTDSTVFIKRNVTHVYASMCSSNKRYDSNGIGYIYVDKVMTMVNAHSYCASLNPAGNLPIFRTVYEITGYLSISSRCYHNVGWLGLFRGCETKATAESFQWLDESSCNVSRWALNQPDNQVSLSDNGLEQYCVVMDPRDSDKWRDVQCAFAYPFFCQFRPEGYHGHFSLPTCQKSTSLNISNVAFNNEDLQLISNESAPSVSGEQTLKPNVCSYSSPNNSNALAYIHINRNLSMANAQQYCSSLSRSANLPIFRNTKELDEFVSFMRNCNKNVGWIGLRRACDAESKSESFNWIDNSDQTLDQWASGQPDNQISLSENKEEQYCVIMDDNGYWRDVQCGFQYTFFCQFRKNEPHFTFKSLECKVTLTTKKSLRSTIHDFNREVTMSTTAETNEIALVEKTTTPQIKMKDFCTRSTCKHGGTCQSVRLSYICHCVPGYGGKQCEIIESCNIDERKKSKVKVKEMFTVNQTDICGPHGMCQNKSGKFFCNCTDTYFGDFCERKNCSSFPWADWSSCSTTCGVGKMSRTRLVSSLDCYPMFEYNFCSSPCQKPTTKKPKKKNPLSPTEQIVAEVAHTLACLVLVCCTAFTFVVFALMRIKSLERMLHACQEALLFVAHLLVLLLSQSYFPEELCPALGATLQYLFLANFTFLTLESVQTYCIATNVLSFGGFFNALTNVCIGFGIPAAITTLTSPFYSDHYVSDFSCWINWSSPTLCHTLGPIVICTIVSTILIESSAISRTTTKYPLTPIDKFNAALISQKGSVFILAFNGLSWNFSSVALYRPSLYYFSIMLIVNSCLGASIVVFHISSNEKVLEFVRQKFCRKCSKNNS